MIRRPPLALLDRGVWQGPWLGPGGELVLIAVRADHSLNGEPTVVPHGASRIDVANALLAQLDVDDPPRIRLVRDISPQSS